VKSSRNLLVDSVSLVHEAASCGNRTRPKQLNKDKTFGTWSVRSLNRSGSLTIVSRESARFNGFTGGSVGQRRHCKSRGFYIKL